MAEGLGGLATKQYNRRKVKPGLQEDGKAKPSVKVPKVRKNAKR
jgi:hypothetical protein